MAVTLSVDLTDQEQARLAEVAELVQPGATPAQVKAWAEGVMRRELRLAVRQRYLKWLNDQQTAARLDDLQSWDSEWSDS